MIVPDTIEPVVGWKGLALRPARCQLRSKFGGWEPVWPHKQQHEAGCSGGHTAPGKDCTCGFYIARNYRTAMEYAEPGGALVEVYGWGKTVEHQVGWRVQYAYPKRIVLLNGLHTAARFHNDGRMELREREVKFSQTFADELAEAYGVPVMIVDHRDYPERFSPRTPLLLASRLFLAVYAFMMSMLGFFKDQQWFTHIAFASILLLALLHFVPLQGKPPHEKKEKR